MTGKKEQDKNLISHLVLPLCFPEPIRRLNLAPLIRLFMSSSQQQEEGNEMVKNMGDQDPEL